MQYKSARNIFMILALLIASMFLGACGKDSDGAGAVEYTDDQTLNLAMVSDMVSMDVHRTTSDYIVPMNVFDTLFIIEKDADGTPEIKKGLVDDYDISVDGLTYNFKLKDNIEFSDGTPLSADDVKFTFERMLTLPDSQQTDYAISIVGAQDLLDGKTNDLKGITVEDGTHFTITLSEPFSGFLAQLATPSASILSRTIVTDAGDDFGVVPEKTIGTGPYVITSWEKGSGLTFEYNPRYWGNEPSVKKVVVKIIEDPAAIDKAFQNGELDILDCFMIDQAVVESTYKKSYADRIVSVDRLGMNYFMLNEKVEPLSNVLVRRAIQMAIDRQSILDSLYSGDGMIEDGIFPRGCLGYSQDNQGWLKYDPEQAKQLLEEAGYPNGFDMELAQDTGSADVVQRSIEAIAQNLKDIGINATVKQYDHASWLDLRSSGDMSSFQALWLLDFNDPDNIIYTFFGSKENTVLRSDNYSDDETIARIAAARAVINQNDRMREYAALEKKLVREDAVWVPLFSLEHLFVTSDKVADFIPQWAGWGDFYFTGVKLK